MPVEITPTRPRMVIALPEKSKVSGVIKFNYRDGLRFDLQLDSQVHCNHRIHHQDMVYTLPEMLCFALASELHQSVRQ